MYNPVCTLELYGQYQQALLVCLLLLNHQAGSWHVLLGSRRADDCYIIDYAKKWFKTWWFLPIFYIIVNATFSSSHWWSFLSISQLF